MDKTQKCGKHIVMETNAGTKRIIEGGNIPNYGTVYYNPTSITNVFRQQHGKKGTQYVYKHNKG